MPERSGARSTNEAAAGMTTTTTSMTTADGGLALIKGGSSKCGTVKTRAKSGGRRASEGEPEGALGALI